MNIVFVILQSFLLVAMAFGGASKLAGAKNFVDMFDSLRLPQWFRVVTGLVQLAGAVGLAVGYWKPEAAAWAGIGSASRCWQHAFRISESSMRSEKRYRLS
jgi:DoxX-like family